MFMPNNLTQVLVVCHFLWEARIEYFLLKQGKISDIYTFVLFTMTEPHTSQVRWTCRNKWKQKKLRNVFINISSTAIYYISPLNDGIQALV